MTSLRRKRVLRPVLTFARRDPLTALLALWLVLVIVAAVLAPWIAPYPPNQPDLSDTLQGPSAAHWLGTDDLGRDVLSRLMYGAQVSLRASLLSVGAALIIAVPLGLAAGYVGGHLDNIIMRVLDVMLALPGLVLVIALATAMGGGLNQTMLALSLAFVPNLARITRAETLAVRGEAFIEASQSIGTPTYRILWSRVLRNITPALQVQAAITMSIAIGAEASLSFIGLGVQPPQASWGSILRRSFDFIFANPLGVVWPALVITLTAWAFNALGDARRNIGTSTQATTRRGFRVVTTADRGGQAIERQESDENGAPLVLRVEDLAVGVDTHEDRVVLVEGVSFGVPPGRVLGVVGESGSGKTVTALSLTRLFASPPGVVTRGRIMLKGEDLLSISGRRLRERRGRDVSMVFQNPRMSLNPAIRIVDQVMEVLQLHEQLSRAQARERASSLLEQVGIPRARSRDYPHQLSGGMCQRVMVAIAIACRPPLLIADEPTSALDVTVQAEILDLLHELKQNGMSLVLITHDFGVVADICDEVVVMYAGQIVERGPVAQVLTSPTHPYTSALLAAMPAVGRRGQELASIKGQVPQPGTHGPGCRFANRCEFALPACEEPVSLRQVSDDRWTRCIRSEELELTGTAAPAVAELPAVSVGPPVTTRKETR